MSDAIDIPTDGGQDIDTAPVDTGQASNDTGPFFETEDGHSFKSPDELKEFIRGGVLRHSDYTKKTQSLAEERKAYEAERQKFQSEMEDFRTKQSEYAKIDRFLKSDKGIAFMRRVTPELKNPGSQDRQAFIEQMLEEKIKPIQEQNEQLSKWKEQQETQLRREQALERLRKEIPDFDEQGVQEMAQWLEEIPPGDEEYSFMKLLFDAKRGRTSPAAIERKMAQAAEKRTARQVPNARAGAVPVTGRTPAKSFEAAKAAALEQYGVG